MANEAANSEVAGLGSGSTLVMISDNTIKSAAGTVFKSEVISNLNSVPKVSYTKEKANGFLVTLGSNGEIQVAVSAPGKTWVLQPEIDASYK